MGGMVYVGKALVPNKECMLEVSEIVVGNRWGMLRMDKIFVGAEETVVIAVRGQVVRSPSDSMEGREIKSLVGSCKGISIYPWVFINGGDKLGKVGVSDYLGQVGDVGGWE